MEPERKWLILVLADIFTFIHVWKKWKYFFDPLSQTSAMQSICITNVKVRISLDFAVESVIENEYIMEITNSHSSVLTR